MSASDWEEVKRLAADFQRAQLTSASQKLSERNCIELISKLIELKYVEVIFTNNGKEFLTPSHLVKEMKDELFISGGRINVVELSNMLSVDLSHIETGAAEISNTEGNVHFVLGQLISDDYLDQIAEEINEDLQQKGNLSFTDLTKQFDLPGGFLTEQIIRRLGTIVQGYQDLSSSNQLYTEAFISRNKARIRGVMSAVSKPVPCATLINHFGLDDKLFFSVVEELIRTRRLAGSLSGGKQTVKCVYIPDSYSNSQKEWVINFYKQNGFLEFDELVRLGINDPKMFIKKHIQDENLIYLSWCCIGPALVDNIQASIDEGLSASGWADVMVYLPSTFREEYAAALLETVLTSSQSEGFSKPYKIFQQTFVVKEDVITEMTRSFEPAMQEKASQDAAKGVLAKYFLTLNKNYSTAKPEVDESTERKKDDRRKKAHGGKTGGGTQGRETKTKSTKKKSKHIEVDSSDEDSSKASESSSKLDRFKGLLFMGLEELRAILLEKDTYGLPEEVIQDIAQHIVVPLNEKYQQIAHNIFLTSMVQSGDKRKKSHSEIAEKINGVLTTIKQCEKGIGLMSPEDTQSQLTKYLLKSMCSDVINTILAYLADEMALGHEDEDNFTQEIRQKLISQMKTNVQGSLTKLNKTLSGGSLADFYNSLEEVCALEDCDFVFKKPDKKKDKQFLLSHRQTLVAQLSECEDGPLILHLATLVLFQTCTSNIIHASGKFVPQILAFLQPSLPEETYSILKEFQDMVVKQLQSKSASPEDIQDMEMKVSDLKPKVKDIAITFKTKNTS